MGACVGSGLNGTAFNDIHANICGVATSAGAGPQVSLASQAGGVRYVQRGAAQLLGVDQGVVVGPLLGAQRAPHLLGGSGGAVQRHADVMQRKTLGGLSTAGEGTSSIVEAGVVLSVEQGGGGGHGHASDSALVGSLEGLLQRTGQFLG